MPIRFLWDTVKENGHCENPDVGARMDPREIECEGVNWIHVVQDMDQW
jgi:hypothetical protein